MPTRIDPRIQTAARVTVVPIADLRQWDRNPHTGDALEVTASLQRFGQVVPIVRAPDGWIISGNTTLRCMADLGFTTCAVVTLDAEEQEQVAWGLASNNLGRKGEDDDAKVLALLRDLDILDGTGYTIENLEDLTALMEEVHTADQAVEGHAHVNEQTGVTANEQSYDGYLAGYQQHQVRSVILDYPVETFAWWTEQATALRSAMSVETNADLVVALIAEKSGVPAP